jgi:tRNA threonylcarbamoyladenosine biosynthesis protein TsaB
MKVLALDSTLAACSVAVCDGEAVLANGWEAMTRGHAERMIPMALEVMTRADLPFDGLDLIAVTVGPGSFAGVRVGLAAARGLALAADLPVAGFTTHETIAASLDADTLGERSLAVALDARRGQIYLQTFARDGATLSPPLIAERADCRLAEGAWLAVGSGADAFADHAGVVVDAALRLPDARDVAALAIRRFGRDSEAFPKAPPAPLYLRAADAKRPGELAPVKLHVANAGESQRLSALHGRCFREPWAADFIGRVLERQNSFALVAVDPRGQERGFAFVRQTADEAELLSIGVVKDARKSGIGARLLAGVTDRVRSAGARYLFLEVAEDNLAARTLYARAGFKQTGRRKGYYENEQDSVDALTLTRALG